MQLEGSTQGQSLLRREFDRRSKSYSSYRLDSFAKFLGVSSLELDGILRGTRSVSMQKAIRIVKALDLVPSETQSFLSSVVRPSKKFEAKKISKASKASAAKKETVVDRKGIQDIALDTFHLISDWYHYAMLELTRIPGVRLNAKMASDLLQCSFSEISEAIDRLKRLGLLEERGGRLVCSSGQRRTPTDIPSAALRRRHLQILLKAKQSLLKDSVDERDFTSMTMAIDSKKLPEAKKRITAFRRELSAFLETGKPDRVYELSVTLFPLARKAS